MLSPGNDSARNSAFDFKSFQEKSGIVGAKAVGLNLIPSAWTPPYIAIDLRLFQAWSAGDSAALQVEIKERIDYFLDAHRIGDGDGFIVRSSGVLENITERGRFKSVQISKSSTVSTVIEAAFEIFSHAHRNGYECDIAIVVQVYYVPTMSGHLSNEVRVSPTRNQWIFELEKPNWAAATGLNSKFALLPDSSISIQCFKANSRTVMRSVGCWLNHHFGPRVHIEWIAARQKFWIVQVDIEWRELDEGFDPHRDPVSIGTTAPDYEAASIFNLYSIGTPTPWRKLQNLSYFDYGDENSPKLFFCIADTAKAAIEGNKSELIDEINRITGRCAVIRTDVIEGASLSSFNLPRTDTVTGEKAVEWLEKTIMRLSESITSLADIAFVLHAFIPASAGAWAYADPDRQIARVDSLWGLPDGLQVLPHDSFQVDIKRKIILARTVRFKPRFLSQTLDGTWKYVDVMRSRARGQSLSSEDIIEIACRTAEIANRTKQAAQIMWFSGVPASYMVGRNLPWYRTSDVAQSTLRGRPQRKPYRVSKIDDLAEFQKLSGNLFSIKLDPEAELIRSEKFLGEVIRVAIEHNAPVEIEGSILSHTFYRLTNEGINVVPPSFARYERQRGRRVFGKLVRDKVPLQINVGGERSIEARLRLEDMVPALLGKLLEEVREFVSAKGKDDSVGEMADVLEVVKSICDYSSIDWSSVENAMRTKREKRGGFRDRKILKETSFVKTERTESLIDGADINIDQLGTPHAKANGIVEFPFSSVFSRSAITRFNIGEEQFRMSLRYESSGFVVSISKAEVPVAQPVQLSLFND